MSGPPRVLLIGMMGAGKSTTGHLLARRLEWPYLDSDEAVQRQTGKTIPEIWKTEGEAAFRAQEARVLAQATTSDGPVVIGVAGGAVLDPDSRGRIARAGLVVWLRCDVSVLAARVGSGAGRPLLDDGPGAALERLSAVRAPIYESLADVVFDVDRLSPSDVVDRIVGVLRERELVPGDA
jgi:shikimate kinase